jgi:hypothetical protein
VKYSPSILATALAPAVIALIALTRDVSRLSGDEPTVWEQQIRNFAKVD